MLTKLPPHPFLLGIFPVLCAFSSLVHYLLPEELVIPLVASLIVTCVIFAVAAFLLKNVNRAAIVTSATMLLIFSFDTLSVACNKGLAAINVTGDDRFYLVPYLLLAGWIIFVLARADTEYKLLTSVLNTMGGALVIGNLAYIAFHTYTVSPLLESIYARQDREVAQMRLDSTAKKPDIYYIILDAMGRHDTLQEFYNYDNSAFLTSLSERGFVVPEHSKSNYQSTCLSLPSSLNMEYLNYLEPALGKDATEYTVLYRLTQRNKISLALRKLGYKYVNVASGFSPTDYMPQADINIGFPLGNIFHLALLRNTVFGPFQRDFDFLASAARCARSFTFDHPQSLLEQPAPKFVFVHIPVPHPPFLFKADGSGWTLDRISLSEEFDKPKYIEQVKYIQTKVLALLAVMDKDSTEKVIIMQGDHGPSGQPGADGDPTPSYLKERMRIFNAYKMPGVDKSKIYDGITPVNSFRLLLNEYFKADLKLLEDECYYSPSGLPYRLTKVTKFVTP